MATYLRPRGNGASQRVNTDRRFRPILLPERFEKNEILQLESVFSWMLQTFRIFRGTFGRRDA